MQWIISGQSLINAIMLKDCRRNNMVIAIEENDKIKVKETNKMELRKMAENDTGLQEDDTESKDDKIDNVLFIIIIISFFLKLPIIYLIRRNILPYHAYFLFSFLLICGLIYFTIIHTLKVAKNHGAEHMVINSHRNLGTLLPSKELKPIWRFSKLCGIRFYSGILSWQIIGFVIFYFWNVKISEILLLIFGLTLSSYFPFYLIGLIFQLFTTAKPDEKNIKLASYAAIGLHIKAIYPELKNNLLLTAFVEDCYKRVYEDADKYVQQFELDDYIFNWLEYRNSMELIGKSIILWELGERLKYTMKHDISKD